MIPKLYAASVVPLTDGRLYEQARNAASADRRAKTEKYQFDRDRRLSYGAELLLRYALSEEGVTVPEAFLTGEQGKPALPGGKRCFNLSHSGEWVLCAIGERETGCDIEAIGAANRKIARRFFCPGEYEYVESGETEEELSRRFTRLWTLKESYLKNVGLGLRLPLDSFEISLNDGIVLRRSENRSDVHFREFADIPGYCCALCTEEDCTETELRFVDLRTVLPR